MGPRNSKETQLGFMKDYEVIQQIPLESLTFLQHRVTEEQYLLKQFNFNDKKQCDKTMQKLAELKAKLAGNKHVVPLKDYLTSAQDQYCSTFYKIYAVFQYPQRTLEDEVNERKLQRKKFTQTELWSILASCIVGLSHLQRNNIKHGSLKSKIILISQQGIIKICDPFALGHQSNYEAALSKRSTQHLYLSPEQCQALQQESSSSNINVYKSDIWTLGMILMEAALLQYQDQQCYRDQKSRIHWQTVQYNISRLGQLYSEEIKSIVEFMLSRDQRVRPDWNDLQEHVKSGDQVRRSFIHEQQQGNGGSTFISTSQFGVDEKPSSSRMNNNGAIYVDQTPSHGQIRSSGLRLSGQSQIKITGSAANQIKIPPVVQQQFGPFSSTFVASNRPQSPRTVHATPLNSHSPLYQIKIPTVNPPSQIASPYQFQAANLSSPNILPIRISNIDQTRPLKNMFPVDFYVTKTKFDENLIVMPEDETQAESASTTLRNYNLVGNNVGYPSYSQQPAQNGRSIVQQQPRPVNSQYQITSDMIFTRQNFQMGSRYEGYKLNGLRHGYGKFYYQDGGMYDGQWRQNKMEGLGKLYYQSGKLAYEGQWKFDQFTGKGILYNQVPEYFEGGFDYHNFDNLDQFWVKYQGQFAEDMKNGKGVLYLANGERFQGQFVADCVEGHGLHHCCNGTVVRGFWNANRKIK